MNDTIIFFGLLDFVLLSLAVVLAAGLVGWALSQRRRKALLAELLNGLTHGAVVVRAGGRVFLANAEARQLWGNNTFPANLEGPWATLIGEVWRTGARIAFVTWMLPRDSGFGYGPRL
jgi:transcriptional regulator of aromatic amino acid metabolism